MVLALEQVTVRAGAAVLLRDVSLAVRPGRVLAVLGPNGAGKSTALNVLAGDRRPSLGRAHLDGQALQSISRRVLATRRAVMRQHAPMNFPLLVHEVVALARHPFGQVSTERAAIREAMAAVDVLPLAGRDYSTLSGGERQRVQIARALAQLWAGEDGAPRYLLMDEPTAHLDLKQEIVALEAARQFAESGGGVLCILHDVGLARAFADDIVLLRGGRVFAAGAPSSVLTAANLQSLFDLPASRAEALAG